MVTVTLCVLTLPVELPVKVPLVACRREIVTTDAVRRVGVLPIDRLSIG